MQSHTAQQREEEPLECTTPSEAYRFNAEWQKSAAKECKACHSTLHGTKTGKAGLWDKLRVQCSAWSERPVAPPRSLGVRSCIHLDLHAGYTGVCVITSLGVLSGSVHVLTSHFNNES